MILMLQQIMHYTDKTQFSNAVKMSNTQNESSTLTLFSVDKRTISILRAN